MADENPPRLPELRQELSLERAEGGPGGTAAWVIVDAVQHRYVKIDDGAYGLLSHWRAGAPFAELGAAVETSLGLKVAEQEIADFVRFLDANNLTVEPTKGGWRHYASMAQHGKHGVLMWLVHNYLFIKLPLFRPEPLLQRLAPYVQLFYSRGFFTGVLLAGIAGLYLLSRQWDVFLGTFQHFFSWQGAGIYALALIVIKSAHELGHAFTARRHGCRVPSMGVCFLVMFPVLYTDVTDAWRIRDRKARLAIGSAGMVVELSLAALATLLWTFLPEGVARSLAFSIATVGWVLSLGINLNPLMRFDGYYLLSDALGVDNLQSRAFAFGQWRLREILFGLSAPPPENLPNRTARVLTVYAWIVWVYRLVVFTGIALLVYHMAFKLLGIVLFLIEIIYFITRPIAAECARWWKSRGEIAAARRSRISAAIAASFVALFFIPWSAKIRVPAVLEAENIARVFPKRAGIVRSIGVKGGDRIEAGGILFVLSSAELNHQISIAQKKIDLVKMRLSRRLADDVERSNSLSMEQELQSLTAELSGLWTEKEQLVVRSPISGVVAELNPALHIGRAIARTEPLALVRGTGGQVARGYILARDVERVAAGSEGSFLPEQYGVPRISVRVDNIAQSGAANIEIPELASLYGGAIAVRPHAGENGHKRLAPVEASYLATMKVESGVMSDTASLRGIVEIQGRAESLAWKAWQQTVAVLVRESGF